MNPTDTMLAAARRAGDLTRADSAKVRLEGAPLPLIGVARMYICGITPYDVTHLGHASTFVWADAAARIMRLAGVDVITARNVTDLDDVLTRVAADRGRSYDEFGLTQQFFFERDMSALRVRRPTLDPHARHHVPQVIQLATALLATGSAYQREGHVFFRGAAIPDTVGLDRETALALSREYGDRPDDPIRDDPFDVPVWLPSGATDPAWPSPWGPGRPGWHAGCAAMAVTSLGGALDVLAGGADLTFPHHAYQVAMVEAALGGGTFARRRLEVGTVRIDGAKMAKSAGNLVLVGELVEEVGAGPLRLMLLDRPWSQAWDYQPAELQSSADRLAALFTAAGTPAGSTAAVEAVLEALFDDLDVTKAIDVAIEAGGEAARTVVRTLALD